MVSVGDTHVIGLAVDFPDYELAKTDTKEALAALINNPADSSSAAFPYESLNAYYQRASYGRLNISGDAFSYTPDMNVPIMTTTLRSSSTKP